MEELFIPVLIVAFLAFGVWVTTWSLSRSRALLNHWASQNGYQLLHSEFRWLRRGPFFWTSSKGQVIYRVVVRTTDGHTRRGWVRCGSFFWGLLQDRVDERWET